MKDKTGHAAPRRPSSLPFSATLKRASNFNVAPENTERGCSCSDLLGDSKEVLPERSVASISSSPSSFMEELSLLLTARSRQSMVGNSSNWLRSANGSPRWTGFSAPGNRNVAWLLSASLVLTATLAMYEDVVRHRGISGCSADELMATSPDTPRCKQVKFLHIYLPLFVRQAVAFSCAVFILCTKFFCAWRLRKLVNNGPDAPADTPAGQKQLDLISGHWTAVASPDIFSEVSALLAKSHLLSMSIVLPATLLATFSVSLQAIQEWREQSHTCDGAVAACCPEGTDKWVGGKCTELCRIGYFSVGISNVYNIGILLCLAMPVMLIPTKVWSPATSKAIEITGDSYVGRMLMIPNLVMSLTVVAAPTLQLYFIHRFFVTLPSVVYPIALVLSICLFVMATALLLWVTPWRTVTRGIAFLGKQLHQWMAGQGRKGQFGNPLETKNARRYRQLVLLLTANYIFCIETLRIGGAGWSIMWPIYFIRAAVVASLLFSCDKESTFEDLEQDGAGFGIVVDARDLRKELSKLLKGERSNGRVRRYKATLLRMCEAMAVSYRWNDSSVNVGNLGPVNMKSWQMEALLKAMDQCGCLYVWIDACAVPQAGDTSLKRVLLSRMMSVYASSFVTAVLLSREAETHRYHQRVWTLQEYCSSPKLIVSREDESPGLEDDWHTNATSGDEAKVVEQLRYEHQARQPDCTPVWLNGLSRVLGTMDPTTANNIWTTYQVFCGRLYCSSQADTVRALYPLLWNMPAESQDELVLMMQSLSDTFDIQQDHEMSLLASSNAEMWNVRLNTLTSRSRFDHTKVTNEQNLSQNQDVVVDFSQIKSGGGDSGIAAREFSSTKRQCDQVLVIPVAEVEQGDNKEFCNSADGVVSDFPVITLPGTALTRMV